MGLALVFLIAFVIKLVIKYSGFIVSILFTGILLKHRVSNKANAHHKLVSILLLSLIVLCVIGNTVTVIISAKHDSNQRKLDNSAYNAEVDQAIGGVTYPVYVPDLTGYVEPGFIVRKSAVETYVQLDANTNDFTHLRVTEYPGGTNLGQNYDQPTIDGRTCTTSSNLPCNYLGTVDLGDVFLITGPGKDKTAYIDTGKTIIEITTSGVDLLEYCKTLKEVPVAELPGLYH
jgi:hypothetical protein